MDASNAPATKADIEGLHSILSKLVSGGEQVLGRLDSLEGRLDKVGARLDSLEGRLDRVGARLDSLEGRLDRVGERLDKLEMNVEELRAEMQHQYDDLVERMTDIETKLLKAFYGFVETNQKRLGDTERLDASLKERLAILESRVIEIEKRLNFPNFPSQ